MFHFVGLNAGVHVGGNEIDLALVGLVLLLAFPPDTSIATVFTVANSPTFAACGIQEQGSVSCIAGTDTVLAIVVKHLPRCRHQGLLSFVVVPCLASIVRVDTVADHLLVDTASCELFCSRERSLGQCTAVHQNAAIGTCISYTVAILVGETRDRYGALLAHGHLCATLGNGSIDLADSLFDFDCSLFDRLPFLEFAITGHRCLLRVRLLAQCTAGRQPQSDRCRGTQCAAPQSCG